MYTPISQYTKKHQVTLVAVSKTQPIPAIMALYDQGQRVFGENRVQELVEKYTDMPKDITWHLIGHLQKNKVKYIAPFISMIHSVDSVELLEVIQNQAYQHHRIIPVLLQFHIAKEETKFGLNEDEAHELVQYTFTQNWNNIQICGVMGMASFTDDVNVVRQEFRHLKSIFDTLKSKYFAENVHFKEISMGMSGDYKIAIEEGSTMVRIGSALF